MSMGFLRFAGRETVEREVQMAENVSKKSIATQASHSPCFLGEGERSFFTFGGVSSSIFGEDVVRS